jgi:cell shape-determining protein MreC
MSYIKESTYFSYSISSSWFTEVESIYKELDSFVNDFESQQAKAESVENVEKELKEGLKETKEKLSDLTTKLVGWAESQNLNTVKRSEVQTYLLENSISIKWAEIAILHQAVNKELSKRKERTGF